MEADQEDPEETEVVQVRTADHGGGAVLPTRRKRKYAKPETDNDEDDPLPKQFRHLRISERKLREELYKTIATLIGNGLSMDESCNAVIEVGNGLFGRKWKKGDLEENVYDCDTLPDKRSIREALNLVEAQSLSLVVERMEDEKR